jgi:hypothetical protein
MYQKKNRLRLRGSSHLRSLQLVKYVVFRLPRAIPFCTIVTSLWWCSRSAFSPSTKNWRWLNSLNMAPLSEINEWIVRTNGSDVLKLCEEVSIRGAGLYGLCDCSQIDLPRGNCIHTQDVARKDSSLPRLVC